MMLTRLLPTLAAIAVLSACAPQRKPLPAPPPPAPAPAPVATATPAPPPTDWRDAPQTEGWWIYGESDDSSVHDRSFYTFKSTATFATSRTDPLFGLTCDRRGGQVRIFGAGTTQTGVPFTITTTSATRTFTAAPDSAMPGWLTFTLTPRDPILDAMAFSRGRFMVEVPGMPALYLPAWPEVGRVIEDCR